MKNILSIECGVSRGSVALIRNGKSSAPAADARSASRAEEVLKVITQVLIESDTSLKDLDMIAVSTGPGSYSGIRIRVSTAVGLANALGVSCVGVSVLEAMSHSAKCGGNLVTAIPVGKTQIAWQAFGHDAVSSPQLTSETGFISELTSLSNLTLLLQADLFERLSTAIPENIQLLNAGTNLAEYIGLLAITEAQAGTRSLQPIYLRDRDLRPGSAAT